MAFQDLKVMQAAYELLSPLDPNAQQRVLGWLSAALADTDGAPTVVHESSAPVQPVAGASAETAPGDSVTEVVASTQRSPRTSEPPRRRRPPLGR